MKEKQIRLIAAGGGGELTGRKKKRMPYLKKRDFAFALKSGTGKKKVFFETQNQEKASHLRGEKGGLEEKLFLLRKLSRGEEERQTRKLTRVLTDGGGGDPQLPISLGRGGNLRRFQEGWSAVWGIGPFKKGEKEPNFPGRGEKREDEEI